MSGEKIWLFDTTLRDGGQTRGVDFSRADKLAIAHALDYIGIDSVSYTHQTLPTNREV